MLSLPFFKKFVSKLVFTFIISTSIIGFSANSAQHEASKLAQPKAASTSTQPATFSLFPHTAHYTAFSGRKQLGTGTRTLTSEKKGSATHYTLSFTSIAEWLFLSDKRTETTQFERVGNHIKSHQFILDRSGTGPNKHYEVNYDYQKKQVTNAKGHVINGLDWQEYWLDSMSEQVQIELDLSTLPLDQTIIGKTLDYHFLNRKAQTQFRTYEVTEINKEELPLGELQVVKIRRVYPEGEKKKIKEMWFAPSMNFILVRMIKKDGSDKFDMVIQTITNDAPDVKPKTS